MDKKSISTTNLISLKGSDLIAIIKEASKAKVCHLKIGDIEIAFTQMKSSEPIASTRKVVPKEIPEVDIDISETTDKVVLPPEVQEEIEVANMLIEDHLSFEYQMIDQALEEERRINDEETE